jgi:DNA-binding transcriptional LysR family regulator
MRVLKKSISMTKTKLFIHDFFYKKNRQQQIRGFYYATLYNSISQAAFEMNLAPSTVTLQIQSLECDLKMKLFKRDTKPLTLTPEGEEFYQIACPLIHQFESVVKNFLQNKKQKEETTIDIAMHHVAISYMMPQIVAAFKKTNPQVKINIRNIALSEAIKRLKEDKIDLAFYPNMPETAEFKQFETASYDPVLIINKNHPLATRQIKSLKDLRDFDLIRIDRNLVTLPLFEEAVRTHQLSGSVEFENGNWEILKSFVKKNDFVAIVSTICLDKDDYDLVQKNLIKFFPKMNYSIAIKSGITPKPILQNLLDAICEVAKQHATQVG